MEREVDRRIEKLEEEVQWLKAELQRMNEIKSSFVKNEQITEKPLTKYFFPEKTEQKVKTPPEVEKEVANMPKKSFEETFLSFLPKIFMIIFVLGMLWGLKLASDYGFLSNTLKVLAGFAVAVGLFVIALWYERNDRLKDPLIISLYGGAYIVGILSTAAGSILYDVLSLNVSLIIALLFIGYGIVISYMKKNEWLTIFVAFTSLLLPYLLDIMEFNPIFIAGYILLLTLALQLVILKFKQLWAMYISVFFGIMALIYLGYTNAATETLLSYEVILLFAIFIASWQGLATAHKRHLALLFSFNGYVLLALVIMNGLEQKAVAIGIVLFVLQIAFSIFSWFKGKREVFDIMGASAIITVIYAFACLDASDDAIILLMLVAVTVGMFVALKLRLSFMKVMYVALFGILALVIYISQDISSIFHLDHLLLVLVIVFAVVGYIYAIHLGESDGLFNKLIQELYIMKVIPIIIFGFAWGYIQKIDEFYPIFERSEYGWSYGAFGDILLAALMMLALLIPKKWSGIALPIFVFIVFLVKSLLIHFDNFAYSGAFVTQLMVRLAFLIVLLAIVADIYWKGRIYRNFKEWIKEYLQWVFIFVIVLFVFMVFGTTNFFAFFQKISVSIEVMINTFSIFIAAIVSMISGRKNNWKYTNYTGIALLIFGFIKMIFFDLAALDILIRSILFLVIGAVGLVVSNRLIKK